MRVEEIDADKVAAFLADLTVLTQKHGIEIDACGCCGSPYLWATDNVGKYQITEDNAQDGRSWSNLEYVRIEDEAQLVSPTSLRPIANPMLLELGESLSDAMERVVNDALHDALILPEGYRYEIVSEAQP